MEERQQKKRANRNTVPQGELPSLQALLLIQHRAGPADSEDSCSVDIGPVGTDLNVFAGSGPTETGLRDKDSESADVGPVESGPTDSGPAGSDPAGSGPADSGPADSGTTGSGPGPAGPGPY